VPCAAQTGTVTGQQQQITYEIIAKGNTETGGRVEVDYKEDRGSD
jgi:hypothetical protein